MAKNLAKSKPHPTVHGIANVVKHLYEVVAFLKCEELWPVFPDVLPSVRLSVPSNLGGVISLALMISINGSTSGVLSS